MSTEQSAKKRTRGIALVIIVIVIAAIILVPKIDFGNGSEHESANAAPAQPSGPPPAIVVAAHVAESTVLSDNISVSGTIIADEEVALVSEVPGKISSIDFQEGQYVSAGTPLVHLDDAELQAELTKARLRRDLAEINEKRLKGLLNEKAIPQSDYDVALNEYNLAKADISLLETRIAKMIVRAPFSGVIGLRQVSKGAYITSGTPIATLRNIDPLKIEFSIPEKYVTSLSRGTNLGFTVDGDTKEYTGTVYAIEPKIDESTRTIKGRATAKNPNGRIKPGAFANVSFPLKTVDNALMIPTQAIIPVLDGKQVYLFRNGKAIARPVITGTRTEETIQIVEGVEPGDTVIISGLLQIRDGADVAISALR